MQTVEPDAAAIATDSMLAIATQLIGCYQLETALQRTIALLKELRTACQWVLFAKRDGSLSYDIYATAPLSKLERALLVRACGIGTAAHPTASDLAICVAKSASTGSAGEPAEIIVAAWGQTQARLPGPTDLQTLADMLHTVRSACAKLGGLVQRSTRDTLTGTLSRATILEEIEREKARSSRTGAALSVLFIDLDNFKAVNDTYGHRVGDLALGFVTAVIEKSLRAADRLGRFGGDEFLVLLPETPLAQAEQVAQRIEMMMRGERLAVSDTQLQIGLTIGCASLACDNPDVIALADHRMLACKARRKGTTSARQLNVPAALAA